MHVYRPIDGFGLYGPVAGFHLEVGFAGHADLNVKTPRIVAEGEAPIAGYPRNQFDLVAVLTGVDAEILSQFVAPVFDAEFHLFRIAGRTPHAAVIGFHAHIGAPRHGKLPGRLPSAGPPSRGGLTCTAESRKPA